MGSHTQQSKAWRDDTNIKMHIPDVPLLLTSDSFRVRSEYSFELKATFFYAKLTCWHNM